MNNNHTHLKRYICIDLEMTEFTSQQRHFIPGANGEIIQFGAVMLDDKFNMISKFSSFVKPRYTSITPVIQDLTGITDELLNSADDFLTVFDKFASGEAKVILQLSAGARLITISYGMN